MGTFHAKMGTIKDRKKRGTKVPLDESGRGE